MKATYLDREVTVKHISSDDKYALVTYDEEGKSKVFKVDLENISGLKKSDLKKLKQWK